VTCWGSTAPGVAAVPAGLDVAVALTASASHACVLDAAGRVTCWGHELVERELSVPPDLGPVNRGSCRDLYTCALDVGARLPAGDPSRRRSTVPADLEPIVALAAGGGHTPARSLRQARFSCWGAGAEGLDQARASLGPHRLHRRRGQATCLTDRAAASPAGDRTPSVRPRCCRR
jgi:hypothetical protein